MLNFYFTLENNRRGFYVVRGGNTAVHAVLSSERVPIILDKLVNSRITSLVVKDDYTEVSFDDSINVVFDNAVFNRYMGDSYDGALAQIQEKINARREKEQLRKLKGRSIKVNRNRKAAVNFVVAASLVTDLLLGGVLLQKNLSKINLNTGSITNAVAVNVNDIEKDTVQDEEIEMLDDLIEDESIANINFNTVTENLKNFVNAGKEEEVAPVEEQETIVEPSVDTYTVNLDFKPLSIEESRYKETDEYWGDLIRHYALRWGLSPELIIAQISQERPNIVNGQCDNICQLIPQFYNNHYFKVPVIGPNGEVTGYDEFTTTTESIKSYEGNIMGALATMRECIDMNHSIVTGLFAYNQGAYALDMACKTMGRDRGYFYGEEHAIEARDLVVSYYNSQGVSHGDPNYLKHVISRIPLDDNGITKFSCYVKDENSEYKKVEVAINNTLTLDNQNSNDMNR